MTRPGCEGWVLYVLDYSGGNILLPVSLSYHWSQLISNRKEDISNEGGY